MLYLVFEILVLFVISTVLFDVVHFLLHQWKNSRFALLRKFSEWHNYHHKFLDENMDVQKKWGVQNLTFHIFPEYLTSCFGVLLGLFYFSEQAVIFNLILHTVFLVLRLVGKGEDINHKSITRLSSRKSLLYVNPTYHFMHHIYPNHFFSSFVGLLDLVIGTANPIKGRRFLITGASGAFGAAIKDHIEKQGGVTQVLKFGQDYTYQDYSAFDRALPDTDVLILAHGSKEKDAMDANCHSFVNIIDAYIACSKDRLVPPEVWATGSEIECHGTFGLKSLLPYCESKRAFAKTAKRYYLSDHVIYRHIVPSAFSSKMGRGLMSAKFAAGYALFFIKRGFYYIPVTYTGLAYLNYIRFRFLRV